jgi:hypothetical protein
MNDGEEHRAFKLRHHLRLDTTIDRGTIMNITYGIVLICVAVVMIWFARPADGVSLPWFKKAWIIGQLYIMTAMVLFVMGSATILGNM